MERARAWADAQLTGALSRATAGNYGEALSQVRSVKAQLGGEVLAEDAARGERALLTLEELRYLNPDGNVYAAVWKNAAEDARGSRWHSLFRR
jgi:hypothetical protein